MPARPSAKAPAFLFRMGMGGFVDGIVLHQLLQIHHVRDDLGGPPTCDLGFLGLSVVLAVAGLLLFRGSPTSGHIAASGPR